MYSVLQVFYKDLWLPNFCRSVKWWLPDACRKVKRSGHSSASWSSEGEHVDKQGVGEAETLHFRVKGKLERSPPTTGTRAGFGGRTHVGSLTPHADHRKGHWSELNCDIPKTLPHTVVKHPSPFPWQWIVSAMQSSCLT